MPDERVQAAISNWDPRFTAQGVDYNDLQRTTARIDTWDDWCREWCAAGDRHAGLRAQAEAVGRTLSAGEAPISAALSYHFGKFMFQDHHDEYMAAGRKCIAAFAQGLRLLDPTGERVEIQYAETTMVGTLRRPAGAHRPPLVFLLPGLDSVKEEFFHWETVFLRRGLATSSLDGPGHGECGYQLPIRPDYEAALTCALDALAKRSDLDLRRVGLAGVSLGGYYAARAAAYEPRVTALVSNCSPWNLSECWDHLPSLSRAAFQYHSGARDQAEALVNAGKLTLEGSAHRIKQPVLIIHRRLERLMPLGASAQDRRRHRRSECRAGAIRRRQSRLQQYSLRLPAAHG